MKEKILLFIYLFLFFIKITFQQPILIPIDPENLLNDEKKDKNVKNIKEQDDEKPLIITQEYKGEDGSNIRITRIHYGRNKNLNGQKSEGVTPIQIMKIFDDRVNSIFEDMIRESLGLNLLLNGLSMMDDNENDNDNKENNLSKNNKNNTNDEKSIFEEIDLDLDDEDDKNKTKIDNKNNTSDIKDKKNKKRFLKKDKNNEEKNVKKFGKLKVNMDNVKKKIKKGKKQLSTKQLIFSRICKYIFYSLIIFTIYIIAKKILEILDIIDPDNAVQITIENEEVSKLKKDTENKQS